LKITQQIKTAEIFLKKPTDFLYKIVFTANPTHIAHIGKAARANAQTKAFPKSAIFPTHRCMLKTFSKKRLITN